MPTNISHTKISSSRSNTERIKYLIEKFKNTVPNQTKQEGDFSALGLGSIIPGILRPHYTTYHDFDYKAVTFLIDTHGRLFFDLDSYKKSTQVPFERFMKEGHLPEIKGYEKLNKDVKSLYKQFEEQMLQNFEYEELAEKILKAFNCMHRWLSTTIFCESLEDTFIKKQFNKISNKNVRKFINLVKLHSFETFSIRFDKNLLTYNKKSPQDIQWIFSDYEITPPLKDVKKLAEDEIAKRGGFDKIKKELEQKKRNLIKNSSIIKKYKTTLNEKEKRLFEFSHYTLELRDFRRVIIQKAIAMVSNGAREICKRKGMDTSLAKYLHYGDFYYKNYNRKDFKEHIEKRKKEGVFIYSDNNKIIIIPDSKGAAQLLFRKTYKKNSLKGTPACKGQVQGRVKIVMGRNDFNKFNEGDILVTSMTRPEFLPILKKAKAVITDEGGITSHAAIVSRELNTPCVIGTKNATKVLKNDDFIEVDATNGTVNIKEK